MFIEGVCIACSEGATEVTWTQKFFCMHGSYMRTQVIPILSDSPKSAPSVEASVILVRWKVPDFLQLYCDPVYYLSLELVLTSQFIPPLPASPIYHHHFPSFGKVYDGPSFQIKIVKVDRCCFFRASLYVIVGTKQLCLH